MKTKTRIAGIIIRDNKILLLIGRGYSNLWTPGGRLEDGESDIDCLRRELKEEINVDLVSSKFFKEYKTSSFYNPEKELIERVYICEVKGEIKPDAEIESFVWFSKDDFENKKFPMITHTQEDLIPDLITSGIW
ncbi:MAG: NUDIX domain-containing protein [Candidatus Paceibacterota bacterium]